MNVFGIILLVLLIGVVTWLAIDTTIAVVRRVNKNKKNKEDKVD